MREKIKRLIEEMNIEELRILKEDLDNGNYVKSIVGSKIKEKEEPRQVRCNVCHGFIGRNNSRAYTLKFGSMEDRRKANFCKYDCLRYFLTILENENLKNG